jgi:hypothetical protein
VSDLGGGGSAAAFALLDAEDDCDPDDRKSDGVPSNRGASSGGTMSTTMASCGGGSTGCAPRNGRSTSAGAAWPRTEITSAGRMNRFNLTIEDCVDTPHRPT